MPKDVKTYPEMYGITIAIIDEKVLSLDDIVVDFDKIINDELDPITTWDGVINSNYGSVFIAHTKIKCGSCDR